MELEKEDFIKTQIVGLNEPLVLYGAKGKGNIKSHPIENFEFELSNFRILDKLPTELVTVVTEDRFPVDGLFNKDGSLKKENNCIVKVDFKITSKNNTTEVTSCLGFTCYRVTDQYEIIKAGGTQHNIYFGSYKDQDMSVIYGPVKIRAGETYSDTVYFVIDKVTEDNCNIANQVAPFGLSSDNTMEKALRCIIMLMAISK